jgi:DNA polymerase-3 subunit delta'
MTNYAKLFDYQPEIVSALTKSFRKKRLVHAYLFEGQKGARKMDAAVYLSSLLLCQSDNPPCGVCPNCRKVNNLSHGNIYIIEPENEIIKKDQIEALLHELSSTSLFDGSRIYIIKEAHLMNTAASNALLKFLEEPHPQHYLILLSTQPHLLLDTIKSRVQTLHFNPISKKKMTKNLRDKGIAKDIAYCLAHITSSEEEADELIKSGEIIDIVALAKDIQKAKNNKQDSYLVFLKKGRFLFGEAISVMHHQMLFDVLMLLVREKIKAVHGDEDLFFVDCLKNIDKEKETPEGLIRQLEVMNKYQERIKYHVNMELLYASMFLEF